MHRQYQRDDCQANRAARSAGRETEGCQRPLRRPSTGLRYADRATRNALPGHDAPDRATWCVTPDQESDDSSRVISISRARMAVRAGTHGQEAGCPLRLHQSQHPSLRRWLCKPRVRVVASGSAAISRALASSRETNIELPSDPRMGPGTETFVFFMRASSDAGCRVRPARRAVAWVWR